MLRNEKREYYLSEQNYGQSNNENDLFKLYLNITCKHVANNMYMNEKKAWAVSEDNTICQVNRKNKIVVEKDYTRTPVPYTKQDDTISQYINHPLESSCFAEICIY